MHITRKTHTHTRMARSAAALAHDDDDDDERVAPDACRANCVVVIWRVFVKFSDKNTSRRWRASAAAAARRDTTPRPPRAAGTTALHSLARSRICTFCSGVQTASEA